ncbi:MAG: RNase H-like domain-containing protein, partial [Candidatus Thiodiazotropha sp.]
MFQDLHQKYDEVFNPEIAKYNGAFGSFEATVNMGPTQPPQRKGKVPQYSRDKLVELQQRFDDLEAQGVFKHPHDLGITAEYLNPSFLVKKPSGGFRLVTAFTEVGRYSKPQQSLMPDVDSTLRTIAQWQYIIQTDLTKAFYQIPLSKASMKYCGVATPFHGVRVYTRCAMGMPGSETALEELMCRVLGDFLQDGIVTKLADDLYCGGNTPNELLCNWEKVLKALSRSDLRLSASKTVVTPLSTTILGWVWNQGTLAASPHRIAPLSTCSPPETVRGLRSFIGAYKVLGRVLPHCSQIISDLDNACAGKQSQDRIVWSDELMHCFQNAQESLSDRKTITLPRPNDQLWIVTDGSVSKRGIGATLYISRDNKLHLAGFFSAKLRKHQVTWIPCEIEALAIASAVKHFSPYIIQSKLNACVLTDSKPCVQAFEKLARGEFSASPRVTSFLSTVSRYQVSVRHLDGSANRPSDFASRTAPECNEPRCQICSFILQTEDSVVRPISVQEIVDNMTKLPFTTRSSWLDIQSECPDLRRTHAHLKQGTRPSKKVTNAKDVKRYLAVASISKDGLLVVPRNDPLSPARELIIVPRPMLHGLVTALHLKLDHPSKHQLELVMKRHFYALDITQVITHVTESCHVCSSLQRFPNSLVDQTSDDPPETIGVSFAADVMKQNRQLILVLRETVSSYTTACIIEN